MKKQSYALKCVVFFLLLIPTAFSQIQQRNLQVNMPGLGTNAVAVLTFSNGATGTFNSSTGELIIFAGSGFGTGSVNPWTNSFSAGGFGLTNLSLLDTATLTVGETNVFQLFDPAGAASTLSNWFNSLNTTFSNWTVTAFDTNGAAASVAATLGDLAHSNSATYSTQFDTNGAARALTRYFDFHQITNATPVYGLVYSGYNSNLVCSTTIPFGMTFNGNLTVNGTVYYNTVVNNYTNIYLGVTTNYVNQTIYTTNYSYQVTIVQLATNVLSVIGGWVFNNSYLNGTNMSFMSAPHFTDTKGSNLVATGAWDWSGASWLNPPTNGWVFGTTGALTNSGGVLTSTNGIVSLSTNGWVFGTTGALTNSGGVLTSTNGIVSLSTNGWTFGTPSAITNITGGGTWNIANGISTFTPKVLNFSSLTGNISTSQLPTVGFSGGTWLGGQVVNGSMISTGRPPAEATNTVTLIVNGTTNTTELSGNPVFDLGNIAVVTGSVAYLQTNGNGSALTGIAAAQVGAVSNTAAGISAAGGLTNNGVTYNGVGVSNGSALVGSTLPLTATNAPAFCLFPASALSFGSVSNATIVLAASSGGFGVPVASLTFDPVTPQVAWWQLTSYGSWTGASITVTVPWSDPVGGVKTSVWAIATETVSNNWTLATTFTPQVIITQAIGAAGSTNLLTFAFTPHWTNGSPQPCFLGLMRIATNAFNTSGATDSVYGVTGKQ